MIARNDRMLHGYAKRGAMMLDAPPDPGGVRTWPHPAATPSRPRVCWEARGYDGLLHHGEAESILAAVDAAGKKIRSSSLQPDTSSLKRSEP